MCVKQLKEIGDLIGFDLTDGVAYQLTAAADQKTKSVPKRLLIEITKTNFCRFQVTTAFSSDLIDLKISCSGTKLGSIRL